jgi:hypothetical protein
MDIIIFVTGLAIGGAAMFFAGFLKKAGEDFYAWAKRKIYPQAAESQSHHMFIHMNEEGSPVTAQITSQGQMGNPLLEKVSALTIDDIAKAITKAPPLQQKQVAENYVGLKVEWDTVFRNGRLIDGDLIRLQLLVVDATISDGIVWCEVPAKQYRELAILPKNSKIRIYGEIEKVDSYGVDIKDAHLHIYSQ